MVKFSEKQSMLENFCADVLKHALHIHIVTKKGKNWEVEKIVSNILLKLTICLLFFWFVRFTSIMRLSETRSSRTVYSGLTGIAEQAEKLEGWQLKITFFILKIEKRNKVSDLFLSRDLICILYPVFAALYRSA